MLSKDLGENEARSILGLFLFQKDEIYKKTGALDDERTAITAG